jgi:hypothetical protein
MTWCLRFADILEPNRDWGQERILYDCAKNLQEYVYKGQMAMGKFLQSDSLIRWFEAKGFPVHPNLRQVKDVYALEYDETTGSNRNRPTSP